MTCHSTTPEFFFVVPDFAREEKQTLNYRTHLGVRNSKLAEV